MDRLALLDELIVKLQNGYIYTAAEPEETIQTLRDIREIVYKALFEKVKTDITDPQTTYYAPEYESWKDYLGYCNNNDSDYAGILEEQYSEEFLESLWQSSHVAEVMTIEQVWEQLIGQLRQIRIHDIASRYRRPLDCDTYNDEIRNLLMARLIGLYNILYEG